MKSIQVLLLIAMLSIVTNAYGMFQDDPWLTKVMTEFEYLQDSGDDILEWDIDVWTGRDLSKYWIKSAGEYSNSEIEEANIEFVYSRAISAYWDQQFGIRQDLKPKPDGDARSWLSYGFIGTAPYFISVDARLFVGEEDSSQLLIELERELMITQQWVLTPELDIIANGQTNSKYAEGSGLAEIEFSLRLGYEHNANRKFQPFIGVTAQQTFGTTRRLAKSNGDSTNELELIVGIHSWF